jgi:chaperonin GroES
VLTLWELITRGSEVLPIAEKESEDMKLQPLNDRIVVKRTEEEEVTKGGIIIPDSAKEKPIQGKILAVGTGRVMDDGSKFPLDVKKGDTVLFSRYAGAEVKIEGEDLLIMREEDVLAVVEK